MTAPLDSKKTVFISTSITKVIDPETGLMQSHIATRISRVAELLKRAGHEIVLAVDREAWGNAIMSPAVCTQLDFQGVTGCDHLVAIMETVVSECLLIELGWASASQVPITILAGREVQHYPLVKGLPSICDAAIYPVDWSGDEQSWVYPLQLRNLLMTKSTSSQSDGTYRGVR